MDFADPGPLTMIAVGLAGSAIFLVQSMRRIPSGYRAKFMTVAVAHIIGAIISTVVQAFAAAVIIGGIGVTMIAITCATRGKVETFFEPVAVGLAGTPEQVSATRRVQKRALMWAGLALAVFFGVFHSYVFAEAPLPQG